MHSVLPIRDDLGASPIGRLVRCRCGHGIGAHSAAGCHVTRPAPCTCRDDRGAVLEAAIRQAAVDLQREIPRRSAPGKP